MGKVRTLIEASKSSAESYPLHSANINIPTHRLWFLDVHLMQRMKNDVDIRPETFFFVQRWCMAIGLQVVVGSPAAEQVGVDSAPNTTGAAYCCDTTPETLSRGSGGESRKRKRTSSHRVVHLKAFWSFTDAPIRAQNVGGCHQLGFAFFNLWVGGGRILHGHSTLSVLPSRSALSL